MEDKIRLRREIRNYTKFLKDRNLVFYEIMIFFSILIFFIRLNKEHPPLTICIAVQPQTWVLVFVIIYPILSFLPLFLYSLYHRKNIRIRELCNLIRITTIILAIVFYIIRSFTSRGVCILYYNLDLYELIILLITILPMLSVVVFIILRKIKENSREME